MSDGGTERGGPGMGESRRQWFEDVLGDAWFAQGDGTYRLVVPEAPLARDDSQEEAKPDPIDEAIAREQRLLRAPSRRNGSARSLFVTSLPCPRRAGRPSRARTARPCSAASTRPVASPRRATPHTRSKNALSGDSRDILRGAAGGVAS